MASFSSSRTWEYDVFPSFSGEDIRFNFLSHFLKELDQRLITVFKDNEIQRGGSLDPELVYAIMNSRIAVVLFSKKYASSSWCLNELLEIVNCKLEFGQIVIPVFYGLEPSHVRKQTGDFGRIFEETCKNKTEELKNQWQKALTDVATMVGYHSQNWDSEALMIEKIVSDILGILSLKSSPSNDFEDFVGLNDRITKMNSLLNLESKEVKMVGIWGASGIGKTTIARALYSQLSGQFQGSIFIDRPFISKSLGTYSRANPDDYSMKLLLQKEVDHLGAVRENRKVLIVIDDLDDYVILETLADQSLWFGSGSRIIVVTNDKHLLRAHGIDCIYEVGLPSEERAFEMLCQSAFRKKSPPESFEKLVVEVARSAGSLPLGLTVLGSSLREKDKDSWGMMLPRFQSGLDGRIEKKLRMSYDGLNEEEKALFRHIACLFNLEKVSDIKLLLEDSNLDVNFGIQRLVDKSLVHIRYNIVEMSPLLQKLGKEIVRQQSIDDPGKREFLVDPREICYVLEDETGTGRVLGISLDIDEIDEWHIYANAFKGMRNLRFLKIFSNKYMPEEKVRLYLPDSFDYLLPKLRLLCWYRFPMKILPSIFNPANLVKLKMENSKLEKMWEGIQSLGNLREINLWGSEYLKELPNLSTAINLEELDLSYCSSLMELPSSIQNLPKLKKLYMLYCNKLQTLPTRINLPSLDVLDLTGCSRLRIFPDISSNISMLQSLDYLCLRGCLRLKSFPNISTNISELDLGETGVEEVPWWIENFSELVSLTMEGCSRLKCVSLNISKLKYLKELNFSDCGALTRVELSGYPIEVAMEADNIDTFHEKASSSLPDSCIPKVDFNFMDCFNLDQEALLHQQKVFFNSMMLSGEEMPSYFTHRAPGNSLTNIPLLQSSSSQPFFRLRACAVVDTEFISRPSNSLSIQVYCWFKDRLGNHFDYVGLPHYFKKLEHGSQLLVFDCYFTLTEDNAPLAELNYDHVDIKFHLVDDHSELKLKGCGVHLLEDGPYLDDRPVKEENKHGKVSKSSTMVTYERHMPQHQVFINFWGEEVRFSFISHLVSALSREGVNIFIGKYEKRDEDLENSFWSMEDSNIALVVFSSTYTESRRCLEELVKIKEQMDEDRIIPIFYKVQHSHVKELDGDFGLQFWNLWRVHRDHRIINWKDALESVASMKGFYMEDKSSESKFITSIVKEVLKRISLHEGENPSKFSTGKGEKNETFLNKCPLFGLGQRMKQLEQKLEFDCNETRIIGVVGMAGIGKTTLAMMLHEKWNCKFVRCVALLGICKKMKDNIRPEWLQNTLFEVLLEGECYKTDESLKGELLETKVFVVLDDVSNKKQLEFLLGGLNWIKKGSKIVITSRDKSLIEEFVHDTYVVPSLNYGDALELFRYHAVGDNVFHPTKMCREFVDCTGGNPLVIKLLVKQLHGRDDAKWEMRQEDVRMVILNIFKSSFDELSDKQKDAFLDIACFFRSENDSFVRSLLDSGDYNAIDAESEVRDLTHKCMIAISGSRVEMHDLMYMFSQAFIEENGGKSRLWYTQEIIDALTNQKDTKSIRGIFLDMSEVIQSIMLDRTTFSNMCNLRFLKIYESCCPRKGKSDCKLRFPDGLRFPLEEVRYLHWLKFPLKELPRDFRPENLVDLRLPYSKIERVWEGVKDTPRLKLVDLSHSSKLLNLSALSQAESLQRLNLESCTNLDELPGEMQSMKSLVYLNLRGCIRLTSLPKMNLISLKTLILSDCSNLKEFQVISKSLEVLRLDGTAIMGLPLAIQKLQRLVVLNLKNCKMLECLPNCLGKLKVLEELILSGCSRLKNLPDVKQSMKHVQVLHLDGTAAKEMPKISCFTGLQGQAFVDMLLQPSGSYLSEWPRGFDGVYSLRRLCLSGNDFASLQNDIGQLYNLTWLDVKHCKKLRSVPLLPPRLQYFDAHGCDSLEKVANPLALLVLTEQVHAIFNFSNCNKLDQDATDAIISYTRRRSQLMLSALSRYNGGFALEALIGTCFPGWEVPKWFSHRGSGSMLEPKLPPHWCGNRFTGIALCAVILFPGYHGQMNRLLVNCKCEFENEDGSIIHFSCTIGAWNELSNTPQKMESSHVFIGYTSISKHGGSDEERCFCTKSSLEFQVTDGTEKVVDCEVLQCGFSLVYATNDRENICWDAKTMVVPKIVRKFSIEEESSDNCRRDDDFQYQSYSGPNQQRDANFITERKSDATQNLWKTFEDKRFELFKNAGGEVTINSNHHSKRTENVEKPSLAGVDLRLKQLEKVLYSTPGKTRIVGVVGMPGFGKTTLANILFEKRGCKFPHNFFLTVSKEDISEELKRMFLKELLEHITQKIREEAAEESLKDNLLQTKVFVVLDNVSDKKQLEFLLGNLKWIKKGSKIIVTTCDKSLLEGLAHDTYVLPHLNNREAFQIFSYHAFDGKICIPTETFLSLTRMFVDNIGGNPLALKLLGSELRGQDEVYWKHKLRTVTQNSKTKMQDVWRFYTDQLTKRHNDVLLDIACFFRSEDEYFIKSLLDSGDPDFTDAVSEVRDLAEKLLITICDGRVEMNEQFYRFGKDFNSPGELRLWKYRDILDKLRRMEQQEANNVRGIFLDMSEVIQSIALERSTFINMSNLRYLKICESCCPRKGKPDCKLQFPDGIDFPLEEVRYFHWLKFPLEELPSDFRPKNLVDLRLPYSKVKRLWKDLKDTPKLKWVDLSHSSELRNLSALSKAESLQRLNLECCTNLDELPGEMQNMKSLMYLNMRGCISLLSIPKMNLFSLKTLILSDCSNLKEFQVISKSLEVLHLDGTAITGLPLAIQKLQRLVVLNLKNCKMLECLPSCLGKLKVLEELILSGCSRLKNLPDVRHSMKHVQILLFDGAGVDEMPNISSFIGSEGQASIDMSFQNYGSYGNPSEWPRVVNRVSSLRRLCLSGNDFVSLQNDIGKLYNLIWLDVKQCKKLRSVPMLPPRLQYFDAHGCVSLERIANPLALEVLTEQIHATFNFSNCNKLDQDATDAIISYTRWKSQLILDALSRYNGGLTLEPLIEICFPGWEIPAWFSHRASGSLLEAKLPPHWCGSRFTGIALCAVILFPVYKNQRNSLVVKCNCEIKNADGSRIRFSCPIGSWSEPGKTIESSHVVIGYTSKFDIRKLQEDNKEGCTHTETSFAFQMTDGTKELEDYEVLKCGFSLVYASDDLQVNSCEYRTPVEANQDITSSGWVQDFFGYIFLVFSCVIIFAILTFCLIVIAPQYYSRFSDFCWSFLLRVFFFVAFGLFLKQETRRENQS